MSGPRAVLDTSVIYAGLRSRRGASFRLLQLAGRRSFQPVLSVPLVLEYEHATARLPGETPLTSADIETVLDFLCSVGHLQEIYYAWRPTLPDPNDDFILELAVAAGCPYIVTFNLKDFRGVESFGITALAPKDFLHLLGGSR